MIRECEIKGYEGYYKILSNGEVWGVDRSVPGRNGALMRIKSKLIATHLCHNGYPKVRLTKKCVPQNFFIHRLVAEAFLGQKPEGDFQVNHKDGIKTNNNMDNLEWITRSENQLHAIKLGLSDYKGRNVKNKSSGKFEKNKSEGEV